MSNFTKAHLEDALTWIERNTHDGIRTVAGALSATEPEESEPAPPVASAEGLQDVASTMADEIGQRFPGTEALVIVLDDDTIPIGACVREASKEDVIDILSRTLTLLRAQP